MDENPFDDADAMFVVLRNDAGQHSLWPSFAQVPSGWTALYGEAGRDQCIEHIMACCVPVPSESPARL